MRGSRTEQDVVSLEIEADGTIGRGEAAPIYYRGETAESALAFLERVEPPDDPFALEAALDGGADGLAVQRRVIAEAPAWLRPGGHVLVETGRSQLDGTSAALRAAGFAVVVADDDESGGLVARGTTYPNGGMEGQSGQP